MLTPLSTFFLQAEDGIRDGHVTGVQTCALPICSRSIWQIEMQNGQTVFGWLSGVVDAQGQVETDIPRLLRQARIDSLPALQLVVVCSDEAETIIDAQQVSRMLQPNALTAGMRLRLWRDRLFERWRWPLIHRADGQMTPPRQ